MHPFPSALDAAVTAVVAAAAGASLDRAGVLAVSMLLLQFSIGALNDWADVGADSGRPGKPIAGGLVGRDRAMAIVVACAAAGLAAAASLGPWVAAVAVAGLAAGFAYDLGLKGTAAAWLCFAAGFVLLPLFAWNGAAGAIPPFLPWVVVLALPAGAVVSLANGLVDLDADEAAGRRAPAVRLGAGRTRMAILALDGAVVVTAAAALVAAAAPAITWLGLAVGALLEAAGWWTSRGSGRAARLTGWRLQAVGLAVLAGSWFAGMAAS